MKKMTTPITIKTTGIPTASPIVAPLPRPPESESELELAMGLDPASLVGRLLDSEPALLERVGAGRRASVVSAEGIGRAMNREKATVSPN